MWLEGTLNDGHSDFMYRLEGVEETFRDTTRKLLRQHQLAWDGIQLLVQRHLGMLCFHGEAWPLWSERGGIEDTFRRDMRRDVARIGDELAEGGTRALTLTEAQLAEMSAHQRMDFLAQRNALAPETRAFLDKHPRTVIRVRRLAGCAMLETGWGSVFHVFDPVLAPLPPES